MSEMICKNDKAEQIIKDISAKIIPQLNESQKRKLAGCMAQSYGYGGVVLVSKYSKISRNTISKGIMELNGQPNEDKEPHGKLRQPGAGRKAAKDRFPGLAEHIKTILEETTYGDPERIICYTTESLRKIAARVKDDLDIEISRNIVSNIIEELGYSKQKNQKMEQVGSQHPDRDAQFNYINQTGQEYMKEGIPVISIDCKKKENIGNFFNGGKEYRPKGEPRKVLDHDFPIKELGKVAPYGIYNVNTNEGYVNLGTSHDTAEFAAESVRRWHKAVGQNTFPGAKKLYITCDGGGSNGSRSRLWKMELAKLSEDTGLEIHVSHFPPGTSKWNKIEHRLFCYITDNWAGQPLIDIKTVVNLIGSTTTTTGLKVICEVDEHSYETGIRVTDEEISEINIEYVGPNPKWNYIIRGLKMLN